jgi:hypothetical protein
MSSSKTRWVDCFYVWPVVQDKMVALQYMHSEIQLADLLTKAHTRAHHCFLLSNLIIVDPP